MHQKPSKEAIEAAQKAEESLVALSDEMGATATTVLMKAIAAFNIHISDFEKIYGTAIAMAVVMGEGDFYKEEIGAKHPKDAEDIRRSARAIYTISKVSSESLRGLAEAMDRLDGESIKNIPGFG